MSERKMREDGLGRGPTDPGCRPTDETPMGSHAFGASIPRAELEAIIRQHIRCDASGLAPAVASVFLCGFDEAAGAISERLACASDERPAGPRPSGLGAEPASAVGKAEAPINSTMLSALKAMDEALTPGWRHPDSEDASFMGPRFREAWLQIRSAISQADRG